MNERAKVRRFSGRLDCFKIWNNFDKPRGKFKIESFSKFEKKNKIEKNTVTWHHLETKNRLRVGNTPFIEHPVWFEQKCKRYREIPYTYSREPISSLSRGVRRLVYESHCANREKSNGVFYQ